MSKIRERFIVTIHDAKTTHICKTFIDCDFGTLADKHEEAIFRAVTRIYGNSARRNGNNITTKTNTVTVTFSVEQNEEGRK